MPLRLLLSFKYPASFSYSTTINNKETKVKYNTVENENNGDNKVDYKRRLLWILVNMNK
jgi:hypothetical protein